MRCQCCGGPGPTAQATFHQNIGALVLRFHKQVGGRMCSSCLHKNFWEYELITLFLGWWGIISCILTLIFLPLNFIVYLTALVRLAGSGSSVDEPEELEEEDVFIQDQPLPEQNRAW